MARLLPQMQALADEHRQQYERLHAAVEAAGGALLAHGADHAGMAERARSAHTSWLLAIPRERTDVGYPCPCETPREYVAIAVDGSQIAPDRHEAAMCCLLNVGRVMLRYGPSATAKLESCPRLLFREAELAEEVRGERLILGGRSLALKRTEAEYEALRELAEEAMRHGVPGIALWDGSLILWSLEGEPPSYRAAVLDRFQAMLAGARAAQVPVVGYISAPGSRDVVNTLRVCLCPHSPANCDAHCPTSRYPDRRDTACASVAPGTDAALFGRILQPGERSALFGGTSGILDHYREEHRVVWFYLHAGCEIARVEMPAWVAEDAVLLAQTHALALDQARKGSGYPPALAEAHECAVVRGPDRQVFYRFIEAGLVRNGIPVRHTQKAIAKRRRPV